MMSIADMFVDSDDSALLVIDIQERLLAAMPSEISKKVIRNTGILIEASKVFKMPQVFSEQYRKGLGPTVSSLTDRLDSTGSFEKLHFDCLKDSEIKERIDKTGKRTVIIAGMETHVCVFQTALSLLENDYNVIIATDAVSSRRKHEWQIALFTMEKAGAKIYSTETIVFMLLEKAGTPEFKKLSPMFKEL